MIFSGPVPPRTGAEPAQSIPYPALRKLNFALRELYAERALTIQPRDGGLAVAVLNDHPDPWSGDMHLERRDSGGAVLSSTTARVSVAARLDDARALWFTEDPTIPHADPGLTIDAGTVPGGLGVRVHAAGLARDVLLQPDRVHPLAASSTCCGGSPHCSASARRSAWTPRRSKPPGCSPTWRR